MYFISLYFVTFYEFRYVSFYVIEKGFCYRWRAIVYLCGHGLNDPITYRITIIRLHAVVTLSVVTYYLYCELITGLPVAQPSYKFGSVFPDTNRTLACSARARDIRVCVE